jgi:lysophospholipase L1-like esterase
VKLPGTAGRIPALGLAVLLGACSGSAPGASPPAAGPSSPAASSGPEWGYVALGDSISTGFRTGAGFPALFAERIQDDTEATVVVENRAVNGATSDDVLALIKTDEELRDVLRDAEVITINEPAGNDLDPARTQVLLDTCGGADGRECMRAAVKHVAANLRRIVNAIVALRGPGDAIIRLVGDYYPFVADDVRAGVFESLLPFAEELDADWRGLAQEHHLMYVDVFEAFNGPDHHGDPAEAGLVIPHDAHPTAEGHARIADLLADAGYAPLA